MIKREWYDVIPHYLSRALAPKCHPIKKQKQKQTILSQNGRKFSAFFCYDIFEAFGLKYLASILYLYKKKHITFRLLKNGLTAQYEWRHTSLS